MESRSGRLTYDVHHHVHVELVHRVPPSEVVLAEVCDDVRRVQLTSRDCVFPVIHASEREEGNRHGAQMFLGLLPQKWMVTKMMNHTPDTSR